MCCFLHSFVHHISFYRTAIRTQQPFPESDCIPMSSPTFPLSSLTRILPFKNLVIYLQCKDMSENQDLAQRSESGGCREHLDHVFQVQRHVEWVYPCSVACCLWYSSSFFLTVPLKMLIHLPGNYLHSFHKHLKTGIHWLNSFLFLSSYWEK